MSTTNVTPSICVHGRAYGSCPTKACRNYFGGLTFTIPVGQTRKPILTREQRQRLLALLEDHILIKSNHYMALGYGSEESLRLMDEVTDLIAIRKIITDEL